MIRLALLALWFAGPAQAHALDAPEGGGFWQGLTLAMLAGATALYGLGLARLWQRAGAGRGVPVWRGACFAGGMLVLVAGLLSPLHDISDQLFTAHMVQHVLLMTVGAPLLALGGGPGAIAWGLTRPARQGFGALARWVRPLTRLPVATALHGITLWLWHAPAAYAAAISSEAVHWLQHASLLGSALLFWQAVLGRRGRANPGGAIAALFLTALHTGLLGVLLTLARSPLYPGQSSGAHDLGLSVIEDQQLAGLVMWVPGGLIYAAIALALAASWIRGSSMQRANHVRIA